MIVTKGPKRVMPLVGIESLKLTTPVLLVEGAAALAAAQKYFPERPCLTWEGGEHGVLTTDWNPLKGRVVTLYPRHDDAGVTTMHDVAHELWALGCALRIVDAIGTPLEWDLAKFEATEQSREDVLAYLKGHTEPLVKQPTRAERTEKPQEPSKGAPVTQIPRKEPSPTPPKQPAADDAFVAVALADISDEVRPQVVQNIFEAGCVAVLAGSPNAGKTFIAVHLGVHVAAGEPWFGAKVAQGPVVYVAAEAPGSVKTRARLAASHGFKGKRLPFYVVSASPGLGSDVDTVADTKRLMATLSTVASEEGAAVKLLIIDTVASVLGGGEENADGMLLLAGSAKHIAQNTNAAVILVHHPSKADPKSLRGHSSLAAAVDAIINVETDENTGIRTATLTKSRDSAAGRQIFFELEVITLPGEDYFGDARTSCVVKAVAVPEHQRKRPSGKAQETLLTELEREYRTGITSWDHASVLAAGKSLGLHRNSARQGLKGLIRGGFVGGTDSALTLRHPPTED
jgi:AAA domain